ncbi:TLC domain containing protein [Nitzschia inconspicua]|uniref:TLC domain containing protein n=1 Tax=Nitzschia inconspicua TaxID=303405 RepID=A0A9K3PE57_9STRA|nr:TLC domain containing protein [Nitzschia inconspicua]
MTAFFSSSTPVEVDFSQYPPFPIAWAYTAVDTVCDPLGCSQWRQLLPSSLTTEHAWFSEEYKVPRSIFKLFPKFLSYQEFLASTQQPSSLQAAKQYALETPSTDLADLTTWTAIAGLLVLVWILRRCKAILIPFFSNLGRQAALRTHGADWIPDNEIRITKFGEYVFRLVFHSSISLLGVYLFWNEPWWEWLSWSPPADSVGTKSLFLDYPHQPVKPTMIWYYLVQAAYNLEAMTSLLELSFDVHFQPIFYKLKSSTNDDDDFDNKKSSAFSSLQFPIRIQWSNTCRGDFREMCIHHIVTNLLVLGSSFFRLTRVGSMVFLVHDISDIPVDLSKLANFLKWKATTAMCFATMVWVWMLTRLTILPFVIYRSVLWESWLLCQNGYIPPIYHVLYKPVFAVLIGLLILLHFIWFSMFIRMGYILVCKGEAHDLSEHKKGEPIISAASTGKQNNNINGYSKKDN